MAKETDGGGGKMYRLWRARRVLLWAAALLLPVSCLLTVHLVQTTAAAEELLALVKTRRGRTNKDNAKLTAQIRNLIEKWKS